MSNSSGIQPRTMGTLPVFMTAISTILGAILYLRFGYAVGNVGLYGTLAIILVGHLVTVFTAMAVAEIATNQKVEGGGAYFMISRSFGSNIGAAIGIALFLSQAISVAFYIIAFSYSFQGAAEMLEPYIGFIPTIKQTGIFTMMLLSILMLTKGADVGVKALYGVVVIIFTSLVLFFLGEPASTSATSWTQTVANPDDFFKVFTIIFPAFTGVAAGLGLSGDLKEPKKSIPQGTLWATAVGLVVYILVAIKLFYSASPEDLADTENLVMEKIALWGPIIPIGLAAASLSSALGSIMIAPRTLQALGLDGVLPGAMSGFFAKARAKDNEPVAAILVTALIGFIFIGMGDIDFVAEIISMFFMVTYGAICSISFLEHFSGNPAYRPTFNSKWYFSLAGAILCFYLMFKMNFSYAILSLAIMIGIYAMVKYTKNNRKDLAVLFQGVIFQLSRNLQVFLQKRESPLASDQWRPFILGISEKTFERTAVLDLTSWLAHKYGFGTYLHFLPGFLNQKSYEQSKEIKERLVNLATDMKSRTFIDTIVSPSFTSAIAQSIQLNGVSGKANNMILLDFAEEEEDRLEVVSANYNLMRTTEFDICLLRSTYRGFGYKKEVHCWISSDQIESSTLMVLLSYILIGHKEWKEAEIKLFSVYHEEEFEEQKERLYKIISEGRLPISTTNITWISKPKDFVLKKLIKKKSNIADITFVGLENFETHEELMRQVTGFDKMGNMVFVNAFNTIEIE